PGQWTCSSPPFPGQARFSHCTTQTAGKASKRGVRNPSFYSKKDKKNTFTRDEVSRVERPESGSVGDAQLEADPAGDVLRPAAAAVELHDLPGDGKPQAGTPAGAVLLTAIEPLPDL